MNAIKFDNPPAAYKVSVGKKLQIVSFYGFNLTMMMMWFILVGGSMLFILTLLGGWIVGNIYFLNTLAPNWMTIVFGDKYVK
jgi:hypothetical protein